MEGFLFQIGLEKFAFFAYFTSLASLLLHQNDFTSLKIATMIYNTSVVFYIRPLSKDPIRGKVYMRIIVEQNKAEWATEFITDVDAWDTDKKLPKNNKQLRDQLLMMEARIIELKKQLEYQEKHGANARCLAIQ